ncbi:MAG: glycoside hydrolase family 30 beta sandwich domain-containing protein [Chitinophagales bacterium]
MKLFIKGIRSGIKITGLIFLLLQFASCKKNPPLDNSGNQPPVDSTPVHSDIAFWMTTGDQAILFKKQNIALNWSSQTNSYGTINVDPTQMFQTVDGFGFALTGGSADVLNGMATSARADLLQEFFGTDSTGIGISYLRLSIGASDLSASVFSYDDIPPGQTDTTLENFSLGVDTLNLVPVLKQILTINPTIKILGSPWSPPLWMKTNNSSIGGSLLPQYYGVYANYFVKYIRAMKAKGITIDAITVQNEPLYGGNNPSMLMSSAEEDSFIKKHLGPAFRANGITTKIILYDHNCDRPDYPLDILNDADARQYVDGSAFHLYGGEISALSTVHNAYPDKNVYFTELYTSSTGNFATDLKWHLRGVIIGSTRNWSKNALEWNLANNLYYGPHTNGGCTTCKGAVTIGSGVTKNVGYYIIAHVSKFVRPGSVRIQTNIPGDLQNVAFTAPNGNTVLIVENDGNSFQNFNIGFKGKIVTTSLDAGAVGTYVW